MVRVLVIGLALALLHVGRGRRRLRGATNRGAPGAEGRRIGGEMSGNDDGRRRLPRRKERPECGAGTGWRAEIWQSRITDQTICMFAMASVNSLVQSKAKTSGSVSAEYTSMQDVMESQLLHVQKTTASGGVLSLESAAKLRETGDGGRRAWAARPDAAGGMGHSEGSVG